MFAALSALGQKVVRVCRISPDLLAAFAAHYAAFKRVFQNLSQRTIQAAPVAQTIQERDFEVAPGVQASAYSVSQGHVIDRLPLQNQDIFVAECDVQEVIDTMAVEFDRFSANRSSTRTETLASKLLKWKDLESDGFWSQCAIVTREKFEQFFQGNDRGIDSELIDAFSHFLFIATDATIVVYGNYGTDSTWLYWKYSTEVTTRLQFNDPALLQDFVNTHTCNRICNRLKLPAPKPARRRQNIFTDGKISVGQALLQSARSKPDPFGVPSIDMPTAAE
eukprot:c8815_g1_i1.p1 GENE.c8815_g1_i1~~c8815_g1_i1.p1  ORF type:complete len:278 (+),score=44.69 c8815_g1_i1:40-873(+)